MQTMCETLGVVLCCAHATRKAAGTARSSVRRDQGNGAPLEANGQKLITWWILMRLQYGRPAENELGAVGLDLRQEMAGGLRGNGEVRLPQFCAEIAD
jgi:hypothetical protein